MRTTVDNRIKNGLKAEFAEQDDAILEKTREQLDEYLNGDRREFDVPLLMVGTYFQKSVWNALLKVSYGATSTYLQLAKDINNEKAVRAVANANGANSIGVIIPCHRIIGSDGELVGYGGGLAIKKRLLKLEKNNVLLE
jgi:methylated-DNA-[protein]-cysteine S-methyltransferase